MNVQLTFKENPNLLIVCSVSIKTNEYLTRP